MVTVRSFVLLLIIFIIIYSYPYYRYEYLYNDDEYYKVERFTRDESKKLEDYNEPIKHYHNLMMNFPVEIERTAFTGLFKVSRKIFIETIVDDTCRIKCLLIDTLVERYQDMARK